METQRQDVVVRDIEMQFSQVLKFVFQVTVAGIIITGAAWAALIAVALLLFSGG